jgi:hypothetical protein
MKIARIDQMSLPVTSIATFEQKDIELALALDVTGSMMGRKLRDLKSATKDLVDIMLPSEGTPNKVRVAFAPYAAGVNAGTYTEAAAGRAAANGCTFERQGANPEQDHAPGPGTYLGTGAGCPPSAKVIGLTDDARLLKSSVEDYAASGTTAGHLGAQWASYLVSPNWGGVLGAESRPAPYNDGKTVKAIVLMTDGEFNTWEGRCDVDRFGRSNCNPNGTRGQQSNDRAKEVCEAAKAKGVQVFTVGFELNHPVALATLAACASSANHAFRAENGDELREAFAAIGRYLTNLRIAQ